MVRGGPAPSCCASRRARIRISVPADTITGVTGKHRESRARITTDFSDLDLVSDWLILTGGWVNSRELRSGRDQGTRLNPCLNPHVAAAHWAWSISPPPSPCSPLSAQQVQASTSTGSRTRTRTRSPFAAKYRPFVLLMHLVLRFYVYCAAAASSRTRTDRHVTHPSSFSNSEMCAVVTLRPRCSRSARVWGASADMSTSRSPRTTTATPCASGTGRKDGNSAGSSTMGSYPMMVPSGRAVIADSGVSAGVMGGAH